VRLDLPRRFGLGIVVPDFDLPTRWRAPVLPASYSREDAIFNVQRAALLIAALGHRVDRAFPAASRIASISPTGRPGAGPRRYRRLRAPGCWAAP